LFAKEYIDNRVYALAEKNDNPVEYSTYRNLIVKELYEYDTFIDDEKKKSRELVVYRFVFMRGQV
jgi:hypothetical protein